jgi:3,4-dihydroxy 2-butanone 4-phosphate synthase/GTP cyclohydrolase II
MSQTLHTIEEAIFEIQQGRVVIVVDDEDRENEGDFLTAARNATPELINFMATHGRGLICAPISEERCEQLGLELMVPNNSAACSESIAFSIVCLSKPKGRLLYLLLLAHYLCCVALRRNYQH